ncbi:MAG: UrcA family protein [Brevundimonas sp.]|nr:MAG: UrcA family protein [Brevundimonas sp.]
MKDALKKLAATTVAAAAVCIAPAGMAQTPGEPGQTTTMPPISVTGNSVRVSYRDLDLTSDRGMRVLQGRIMRASHYVCGLTLQPLSQQMDRLDCVNDAKRGAFDQLAASRGRIYADADRVITLAVHRGGS